MMREREVALKNQENQLGTMLTALQLEKAKEVASFLLHSHSLQLISQPDSCAKILI